MYIADIYGTFQSVSILLVTTDIYNFVSNKVYLKNASEYGKITVSRKERGWTERARG